MFEEYFNGISNDSFEEFSQSSKNALKNIVKDKRLIIEMLNNILDDSVLIDKSESYDFQDKFVIYSNDEKKVYARVSVFKGKYANRIHYNRWHYTSFILKGEYTHYIYGNISDLTSDSIENHVNEPLLIDYLNKGSYYSCHNSVIHSVISETDTVSISIRGEALIDKFQVMDFDTKTSWWQYGQKLEAYEERQMKKINFETLKSKIQRTCRLLEEE